MKIKSYLQRGNSFPVIYEENGQTYFVKLSAGMSGHHAMISEWIGNKLGQQLNLNTQEPVLIELTEAVNFDNIYIEVRELVQKSLGLNIGFQYLPTANEISISEIKLLDKSTLVSFFLLDLVMLNIDRTYSNTNLMKVDQQLFTIDFESSLLFQDLIENKNLVDNTAILTCFKNNPLYSEIEEATINQFITKLASVNFESVVAEIPEKILGQEDRQLFLKGIEKRKSNNWFLKSMLEQLRTIKIETSEEQKKRHHRNQAALKKKMK